MQDRKKPRVYGAYKRQYITIYFVNPADKDLIVKAARAANVPVSTFVTRAVAKAASREMKKKPCAACKGTGQVAA